MPGITAVWKPPLEKIHNLKGSPRTAPTLLNLLVREKTNERLNPPHLDQLPTPHCPFQGFFQLIDRHRFKNETVRSKLYRFIHLNVRRL